MIALPSEHTGGDVIVQHRDEKQTLQTQGLCDFGYSYLAWHAGVSRSVSTVESGNRLVLVYNLIHQASSSSRVASVLDDHKQNIRKVLALWSKQDRETQTSSDLVSDKLVYILEEKHSEGETRLDHLKGKDRLQTQYLSDACQEQGFCLFLAQFEYSQSGMIDDDDDDSDYMDRTDFHELIGGFESKWSLQNVFQSDGQQLVEDIALKEEEMLANADFEGVEPDDEECDGWAGQQNATHSWFRACAVILPRARRLEFLSKALKVHVQKYMDTLLREMQDDTLSVDSREELKRLCEMIIDVKKAPIGPGRWGLSDVSDEELKCIVEAALTLDSPDLLKEAARVASSMLPIEIFQLLGSRLIEQDMGLWQHG